MDSKGSHSVNTVEVGTKGPAHSFITAQGIVCSGKGLRRGGSGSQGCGVVKGSSIASATVMNWARH